MKPFRALFPRLGGIPRLPSFLLIRDPFSALLFFTHTKNALEISVFHGREFFALC